MSSNQASKSKRRKRKASSSSGGPREVSSKKRAPPLGISRAPKPPKDPRFDANAGEYDSEIFRSAYGHVLERRREEIEELQKALRKEKDFDEREKLKKVLARYRQDIQRDETQHAKRRKRSELRKREAKLVAQGKTPFYLKKSDEKRIALADKYLALKKTGAVDKYLAKKRRHKASKARRRMPAKE